MQPFTITQPTQIHFGTGIIKRLPEVAAGFGGTNALVVLDPGLIQAGLDSNITRALEAGNMTYTIYSEIDPEPGLRLADRGTEIAREHNCDCVIGVGGGSAMDVAKAIAILLTNGGRAVDYLGLGKIEKPGVPKIMVPTSAGTGAEVTFTAVFINEETGSKGGMNGDPLYPEAAVLDPELTLSLPPHVTAATGIDALTHALEAYTSVQAHPVSEMYSLQAIELIATNLRTAYADGRNIEARSNMLLASLLGGKALAMAGVGLVHAMAYPLGGMFGIPHGLANAVLLPYVTEFNLIGNLEKHALLAEMLGGDTNNMSLRDAAHVLVEEMHQLNSDLAIPASLSDLGIPDDRIEEMAKIALTVARPVENNPRQPTLENVMMIYEYAMDGM
ncbi:alcohol dehydrogenase [Desulfolithobacter dissulfuricans]|uniref:Alcohol dehydrogenase n=1 Tax=Desulfolithobacter dissulfuricans TaxID=2795293 RepID=A0A915XHH6_9BACT|nr:iron-containing alcohol dehydrogenase [Desulfolithobacter dissulfuricans]BCO08674.1 alcohol dehydrogenase [Desulfolithobacter dissulfuricans]